MKKIIKLEKLKVQSFTTIAMKEVSGGIAGTYFPRCDDNSMLEPCTGTQSHEVYRCDDNTIPITEA